MSLGVVFFTKFKNFLFDRVNFFNGVKKEKLVDTIKFAVPIPVIFLLLLSGFISLAGNIFAMVFIPVLFAVSFVVFYGLLHFALVLFGGKGKLEESFQVALYAQLYLYLLGVLFFATSFLIYLVSLISLQLAMAVMLLVLLVGLFLFFKGLMAVLEGFAFFHKTSKFGVFIVWLLLNFMLNVLFSFLFSAFGWELISNFY